VSAIASQLCLALSALEDIAALHGDLRLRNVKLTSRGRCVLIAGGLRAALFQEQSIHLDVPPDDCDGIAPELIGSGRPATLSSDIYALGCLLWELLAGRPPFPHGDPLARLAAHQKQRIPDIRDWAPDTPAEVASLIHELTDPIADSRPPSFRVIATRLQRVRRAPQRQLQRLIQAPVASHTDGGGDGEPKRAVANVLAAAVIGLAACGVLLLHSGARSELLSIARPATASKTTVTEKGAADPHPVQSPTLPSIPQPDAAGVIVLSGPGPYRARDISFPGKLELRGVGPAAPLIIGNGRPLRLSAEQLLIEGVEFCSSTSGSASTPASAGPLLQIQVQQFTVRHCRFESAADSRHAGIEWTLLDSESMGQRNCLVIDSMFHGGGPAVLANGSPASMLFDNVLHCGEGALLELSGVSQARRVIDIEARSVTVRGAAPLIACRAVDGERFTPAIKISLVETALELDQAAVLEFLGDEAPADWQRTLQITGEGSVVPPGALMAGVRVAPDRLRPLRADDVAIDGLMSTSVQFAGEASGTPADSALVAYSGYGRSARPPGIEPQRLPQSNAAAYNSITVATPSTPTHNLKP
jgi:hypothetical protein